MQSLDLLEIKIRKRLVSLFQDQIAAVFGQFRYD